MIPQSIQLTNFICYRQAEVDFSGIHVACLSGENGAGKSALLDAITWALWGRARAKHDDELIYLGEEEMSVELVFVLEGEQYRVLRRRSAKKKGATVLDFQVWDGAEWRSLVENSIRMTQAKIERILRLDYDTFANSAFLRQGHADEFTVKTAAERKRVLGDVLALGRWADYEERAKEQQRAIREEMELTELQLQEIEVELANRPSYEAALATAQSAVIELSAALQQAQEAYQRVEAARMEQRHVEEQLADRGRRITQAMRELETIADERRMRQQRATEGRRLLAQADEIEAGYAAYREAVGREEALGAKLRQSVELNKQRLKLEAQITDARRQIEGECEIVRQRIRDVESRLPDEALRAEYDEVQAQLAHMAQLEESREAARADLVAIAQEQANLRAQNETLRTEMEALRERRALLEQASATCPTCGQPLTEEHRLELLKQTQAEGQAKTIASGANQTAFRQLSERSRRLEQQIGESDRLLRGLPGLRRQEAALVERFDLGQKAAEERVRLHERQSALEHRLAEEDYGHSERQALADVLAQAGELGYDVNAHEAARRAVAEGQVFAERRAQLTTAEARIVEEEEALEKLAEAARRWKEQHEAEQTLRTQSEQRLQALRAELEGAQAVEAELQRLRGEEAAARQQLGANLQRIEACKALAVQRDSKRQRRDQLALEQSIYEELRTAFGVKGVPAMVIEASVPEIEEEANRLLARMTAGRMHVRFETQRETLKGDVLETLEIKIADELGERPYENFSGGEQFRVNFAIRVALSRLLAHRAGAQLQTLVIDEGFGTQDAQGRERLVEAINAIQEEFERVLVITHIEELRDAFPVRIEVTKTPDGSALTVG
ncbi:MAG: SMC family ATPase [Anaerolineales bacterium]|nr:SMC family ATPase [Anaerolineales bacterium]